MRKRLRKKRHRELLTTVCAYVAAFDARLRERLLQTEPGTPFPINRDSGTSMMRLIRGNGLRYGITVARKLGPTTATVVYWAEEFPAVRDEAVIFSAVDLGLQSTLAERVQEQRQAAPGTSKDP